MHSSKFSGKSVVELGGGHSCLAGLCIAANSESPGLILLTDGNLKCTESISSAIIANKLQNVHVHCIRWDIQSSYLEYANQFDYVICADCLFFDEFRQSLAIAIQCLLKPDGNALIFAPRRGNTLKEFVDICNLLFPIVRTIESYCDQMTNAHKQELLQNPLYDPDIHYPILIELQKEK